MSQHRKKKSPPHAKAKTLRVTWSDEAWACVQSLPEPTALAIMSSVGLGVRMLVTGRVCDKVSHIVATRRQDHRLRIECGHYRAIAERKGDVLHVSEIHYRDEQTYKKMRPWHPDAPTPALLHLP